jgi:amino acid transporter
MAEETREPNRTMPLAIFLSLAITALLYGAVSLAAARSVEIGALAGSERPLALVYETATGRSAGFLAAIAVAAALNGVLAQIVMSSRVLYGLGRRAAYLSVFTHAHPRSGAPVLATLLAGSVVTVSALMLPLATLAEASSVILLAVFLTMNMALLALKRRGPPPAGAFEAHWSIPWLGGAAASLALAAAALG